MNRTMGMDLIEVQLKGKPVMVPTLQVENRTVLVLGKWLRVAAVHDESWLQGEIVENPDQFLAALRHGGVKADLFTFTEKIPQQEPTFRYHCETDNFAVVPISTYADWWEKRLPQETRRNVRLAAKRGVVVKVAEFNDKLVAGIAEIYNETTHRQGRAFCHYGKDMATVRAENATYLERSQFIGAYCGDELIGFMKLVHIDGVASIMQFLSKNAYVDMKPMNALLAKAVELVAERGSRYLVYRKYTYGNVYSPLTEFKRRNGFEEMRYPRYYVPLTWKGELGLRLRLHRGIKDTLPPRLVTGLKSLRSKYNGLCGAGLFGGKKPVAFLPG